MYTYLLSVLGFVLYFIIDCHLYLYRISFSLQIMADSYHQLPHKYQKYLRQIFRMTLGAGKMLKKPPEKSILRNLR